MTDEFGMSRDDDVPAWLVAEYERLLARALELYAERARLISQGVDPRDLIEVLFPTEPKI